MLAVPWMWVPGAITSGLTRLPGAGPRLEKSMTSMALSAPEGPTRQSSVQAPSSSEGRWFSEAPTVIMFFPFPGVPTVPEVGPELPAEKRMIISWLPGSVRSASRTPVSYACDESS